MTTKNTLLSMIGLTSFLSDHRPRQERIKFTGNKKTEKARAKRKAERKFKKKFKK